MTEERQQTITRPATVSGAGLHTGETVTLRLLPAPPNTGVVFVRSDLPHRPTIPASPAHAVETGMGRRTILAKDGVEVQTVEHLLASLWGLGVDNVYAEISGLEVPGLDGSAALFVTALKAAGVTAQAAPRKFFSPREPIVLEEGDSAIAVFPDRALKVSYTLSYDHPLLKAQFASFSLTNGASFEERIAPARTFCLQEEAQALRAKGFGRGATYENTLVLGDGGVIQNTLRFEDEFVRHKILDLLGDLYLLGAHLRAHVMAIKSGHPLNVRLLHKLAQAMEQWKLGSIQSGTQEVMVGPRLDITQIEKILPHRYPFLLVDRVIELTETKAVGLKCVTINDYFFRGHFPGHPVMPGVLMIEAMAQVGGILILNKPENKGRLAYFMSVAQVKFRKPVVPGDQLVIEAHLGKLRSRTGQIMAKASVEGKVVCEGELMFVLADE
ncbi:MAG: UDP-3-O-[3-hydroxymyristoyl] N-acetylglucosamine deacetylase [Candidatus Omnitrophica bacterium]|nr:UDP-3-O-[3-hydroxymyristoyl] N-acetylglucosamine deacetylase [Candidatus Omnitrophota bacterium]